MVTTLSLLEEEEEKEEGVDGQATLGRKMPGMLIIIAIGGVVVVNLPVSNGLTCGGMG